LGPIEKNAEDLTYMIKFLSRFAILFAILFTLASLGSAQTLMTSTTLSAALDAKTKTVLVASATGITAPGLQDAQGSIGSPTSGAPVILLVDQEAMDVVSVSGTTVTVRRAQRGTTMSAHVSGAKVLVGPAYAFPVFDPYGSCTRTVLKYVPIVSLKTFNLFDCVNGQYASFTSGGDSVGAAIASATTIAPIGRITHITGTTAVATVTLPPSCPANGCRIVLIPDGLWSTTNAGNIAIATTGVVSKALHLVYDTGTSKWYPSY
jgi:hypothetical protein